MRPVLDADEVAIAAGCAARLDERDAALGGGMDRCVGRRDEVDPVVQVTRARAAEVATAADDAPDRSRELAATGQRQCADQPPRAGALDHHRRRQTTLRVGSVARRERPLSRLAQAARTAGVQPGADRRDDVEVVAHRRMACRPVGVLARGARSS